MRIRHFKFTFNPNNPRLIRVSDIRGGIVGLILCISAKPSRHLSDVYCLGVQSVDRAEKL